MEELSLLGCCTMSTDGQQYVKGLLCIWNVSNYVSGDV
jgi:hypothetical protein